MNDTRQVGPYFTARDKVKEMMKKMIQPNFKWTREVKEEFEKLWKECCRAYDEHEELCKDQD